MHPFPQNSSEQLNPIFSLTFEYQLMVSVFTLLSQRNLKEAVNLEVGLDFLGTKVRSLHWKGRNYLGSFWKETLFQIPTQERHHHQDSPKQCLCFCCYCVLLLLFLANDGGGSAYYHGSRLWKAREKKTKEVREKGSFKTKSSCLR